MKKVTFISSVLAAGTVAYNVYKNRASSYSIYDLIQKKMENSGYTVRKTNNKGVFILEKNQQTSYLIYDNFDFNKEPLFNLLLQYSDLLNGEIHIISDTDISLFTLSKPYFYHWAATKISPYSAFTVHFSTLQIFKSLEEPTWETTRIKTHI